VDDPRCLDFFRNPTHTAHRHYEALRAVVLEHRPMPRVAQEFGFRYGSLRNLVADFRARCRAGQPPPFSPRRPAAARPATPASRGRGSRRHPRPQTAANSSSPPAAAYAPAWPASSSSCRCSPACTSTTW
jgi:hypothetical protein